MSYEIIYRRQFIKVDETRVIPMMEIGSNNCYEAVSGRRARDWYNINLEGKGGIIKTIDDILKTIDNYEAKLRLDNSDYNPNNFGYYSSISFYGKSTLNTKFITYRNYFVNGFKEAMTIEQLLQENIRVGIHVTTYNRVELQQEGFEYLSPVIFENTQHMIDTITYFETYYKYSKKASFYIKFESDWAITDFLNTKANLRSRKRKTRERKEVKSYFVLVNDNGGYFVRKTKYGYKYSMFLSTSTKRFLTEKQAQSYIDKYSLNLSLKKIESEIPVYI
jgi:hypothetical protein